MQHKIKSSLIEPSWFEKAIFDTLKMYEAGKDLAHSPLNEFQRNYKTWGGRHESLIEGDFETNLWQRTENFIALFESIKKDGYQNKAPLFVWFDDDGFIRLYDGHHRLSICRYLGIDPEMEISTNWSSVGIDPTGIVGRDFPLVDVARSIWEGEKRLYHFVNDPFNRLADFSIQRPDSDKRRDYLLQNLTGKSVFDIGCSEGYLCHELGKAGFEMTGIEKGYEVNSDTRGRKLIAIARYLATLQNVPMKCLLGDWKDYIREHDVFFDNILYLSVLHNEINNIGYEAALQNLRLFRGKTKRLFIEIPDISQQKDWTFAFTLETFVPFAQRLTGLKLKEVWQGYRPILLFENKLYA